MRVYGKIKRVEDGWRIDEIDRQLAELYLQGKTHLATAAVVAPPPLVEPRQLGMAL